MNVVGIDLALNKSGIAVLSPEGEVLDTGLVTLSPGGEYHPKVAKLYETYRDLFDRFFSSYGPELDVAIEGRLRAGWNGNTLASIEGARVACYLAASHAAREHGSPPKLYIYDPGEIKRFISGKIGSKKPELRVKALSQFSYLSKIPYQEDIFDAIYMCLLHLRERTKNATRKRSGKHTD